MAERLAPCPWWPCCVCSRSDAFLVHRIAPFAVSGDPAAAFARLKALVEEIPRTVIVTATDDYLHAACRTRLGFVDDLQCRLCPEARAIHVRSASRLCICVFDLGVNRFRVERLRRRFLAG